MQPGTLIWIKGQTVRRPGLAVALLDKWIIEYMTEQKLIVPDNFFVVGQSAVGWATIALSSRNLPAVRALVTFAAGRGGRVGGKPNNNCARMPYMWCLTNTCIAADLADPTLVKEMETGQKLSLEVVDSSVLAVSTSLPLDQFSTVHQGIPAQTFEQAIDE
jgi:hypothetical protein